MFRSLNVAATGMAAQETQLDTIANNLANANTTGYKAQRVEFEDMLYQNVRSAGPNAAGNVTPTTIQVGTGARVAATARDFSQGTLHQTGNQLDLAIEGQGFFQVLLPSGETAYTRGGSFHTDSQGNVVTANGNPLQPAITIPQSATSVTIASDGTVSVTLPGQTAAQQVGSLQLAMFPNSGGLNSSGGNLFTATTASGDAVVGTPGGSDGLGQIEQGYLEQSNVSVVDEFINMIVAQRSYEASSRVVQAADQIFQLINNLGH